MILYLTSQAHTNLLDFYSEKENSLPVKKMTGSFLLKQFVVHDMRNFSHCHDLVLDRTAFGDSDNGFAEAIEEFLTMYQVRITVIAEGLSEKDNLFSALLECGVGNIVTESDITGMQEEITLCLTKGGLGKYVAQIRDEDYHEGERYTFRGSRIQVSVVAAQERIGATTAGLGLANWLSMAGGEACYIEANDSGHMNNLTADYEMQEEGKGHVLDGVGYYREQPERDYQFIISDFGTYAPREPAGILVLVCGTKPFELPNTIPLLQMYDTKCAVILFPFVDQTLQETYRSAFETDRHKVLFLNYQPDCLNGLPNANQYREIIRKYIVGE